MNLYKKLKSKLIQLSFVKQSFIYNKIVIKQNPNLLKRMKLFKNFLKEYKKYKNLNKNENFYLSKNNIEPYLYDNTDQTPVDPIYFYQDSWCAKKIFENKPNHHYDIGSKAEMVGIISQFVPTTMIDIRPINLNLNNLYFKKGNMLSLPFKDNSLQSISSICVIEHIGLSRYGDEINSFGSEEAIKEIKRVLAQNGNLYISLPVDHDNIVYFNSQRAFTRDYILKLFLPLKLMEEKYIYKYDMINNYDKSRGFGAGMFHFKK